MKRPKITIHDLKTLPKEEMEEVLNELGPEKVEELHHTWEFWARDKQLLPEGDWNVWALVMGRASGKTRTGAETVRYWIKEGYARIGLIGPTASDVRDTMVLGESGLINCSWEKDHDFNGNFLGKAQYNPSKRTVTFPDSKRQIIISLYSAEEPERLRGPQMSKFWADELAAWRYLDDTWNMLQFCLRLGDNPQGVITTTPKPTKRLKKILQDPKTVVTTGSSYENMENVAESYIETLREAYEGTRLGQQEIYAEILDEAKGALWNRDMLDESRMDKSELPHLTRIVVAVDPAMSSNKNSDETGIIVAGKDVNGTAYVLEDASGIYGPSEYAQKSVELYDLYDADRIVYEGNQGGDTVKYTFSVEAPDVPLKKVWASRSKQARAEPVSALYEQGRVKHVNDPDRPLEALEEELVTWEPQSGHASPNRLDALAWAITELCLGGRARKDLSLSYKSDKEVRQDDPLNVIF